MNLFYRIRIWNNPWNPFFSPSLYFLDAFKNVGRDFAKGYAEGLKRVEKMNDEIIEIDSEFGKQIGFTSDKFSDDSYLWRTDGKVTISLIFSKHQGKGNLSALFKNIESLGLKVAVPTPFAKMQAILERKGFVMHIEDTEIGDCEIWEKPDIE